MAASGGVDSMVLLHALSRQYDRKTHRFVVAHLDHGIRPDSHKDRQLVQAVAQGYRIPFVYYEIKLGPRASEAVARRARYDFLRQVRHASNAKAIVTAHHQDDAIETAIINLIRGTGRRGLTSLGSQEGLIRPLLGMSKADIKRYAQAEAVVWREDSSNSDERYLRNYVRRQALPRLSDEARAKFLKIMSDLADINTSLDNALQTSLHLQSKPKIIDRAWFSHLPHLVACEVMAAWLRAHDMAAPNRRLIEKLVVAGKTGQAGKRYSVAGGGAMKLDKQYLALIPAER